MSRLTKIRGHRPRRDDTPHDTTQTKRIVRRRLEPVPTRPVPPAVRGRVDLDEDGDRASLTARSARRMGAAAVDCLANGEYGVLVGLVKGELASTPLTEVVGTSKRPDPSLLRLAETLSM